MISHLDTTEFLNIFSGAKDFYGVTVVGDIENGKAKSTSQCIHEPLMQSVVDKHLSGEISIGMSPLRGDNTIGFGAIDIDDYSYDLMAVVRAIYEYDMPICPCYSKSKKLHLYFFFDRDVAAEDAIDIMRWYARAFDCSKKVEIFPKQTKRTSNNKAYSWINLPYFNESDETNHRKMVGAKGQLMGLSDFMERAKASRLSIEGHKAAISKIPYNDAPPCILTSLLLNDVGAGGRNNFLFSVGAYLKLKSEDDDSIDLEQELLAVNARLEDPLEEREVLQTVVSSLEKKSYFYICSAMSHCDKQRCVKLELGVGSSKSTGLTYGDFKQYMAEPPYYTWEVNGQIMTFYSEQEILGQSKFRELCMRKIHLVPRKVDDNRWTAIVNKALTNVEVVTPDTRGGDFSVGSQLYDLICEFFADKRRAQNESQLNMGRVLYDTEHKAFAFKANALMSFIHDVKSFKGLKDMEIRSYLIDYGAYTIGSIWYMPTEVLENVSIDEKEQVKDDVKIDLNLHEGESDDF